MKSEAGKNNKVTVEIVGHPFECVKKIMKKTKKMDGTTMNYTDVVRYALAKTADELK